MTQYRLYYMADPAARVRGFEPIEADDDVAAVSSAETQQRALAVELWCAHRLVKRWRLVCQDVQSSAPDVATARQAN